MSFAMRLHLSFCFNLYYARLLIQHEIAFVKGKLKNTVKLAHTPPFAFEDIDAFLAVFSPIYGFYCVVAKFAIGNSTTPLTRHVLTQIFFTPSLSYSTLFLPFRCEDDVLYSGSITSCCLWSSGTRKDHQGRD